MQHVYPLILGDRSKMLIQIPASPKCCKPIAFSRSDKSSTLISLHQSAPCGILLSIVDRTAIFDCFHLYLQLPSFIHSILWRNCSARSRLFRLLRMKRWLNLILLIYCTRWTPLTKAQCPTGAGFQPMTTAQGCTCVYTGAVPVGVTVLSSQQFCLNLDNRSSLIAVNGDAQKNAIDSQMGYGNKMNYYLGFATAYF